MAQYRLDECPGRHHFAFIRTLPLQPPGAMRATRFLSLIAALLVVSCANPRTEANVAQALQDAASEISGLKNDLALLQTELDSLRGALAKHDSTIARIAAVNNIPISR
ncbi:MAG TPA: hypothetical protein VIP11_12985 [Gemmatimonadaceae bacterium]